MITTRKVADKGDQDSNLSAQLRLILTAPRDGGGPSEEEARNAVFLLLRHVDRNRLPLPSRQLTRYFTAGAPLTEEPSSESAQTPIAPAVLCDPIVAGPPAKFQGLPGNLVRLVVHAGARELGLLAHVRRRKDCNEFRN